ncbi:MAG: sigma-54 dependent transcriptional regulator [Myxococcota bacterium]|jgi:two-component system response regulator HydG
MSDLPIKLLIVDDEPAHLESLKTIFEREGAAVSTASLGGEALDIFRRERSDIVLADLMMPGMDGIELLRAIKSISQQTEFVIMTAFGTVETAVEAMKEGAYDFVVKPIKRMNIVKTVKMAAEKQSLVRENKALKAALDGIRDDRVIAEAPIMRRVIETVKQVAPSTATILLLGESGTGKEVISKLLHESSPRASKPFIPVNCAALPESILESELFGFERGAFTGADRRHEGRFERADGGTLLLDEVSEMSLKVQAKLLRVIEDGMVERLGGSTPVKVDVRIIAASNRDIEKLVREGLFREDLFYRLNVISIKLPPLRARREDIPLLAGIFIRSMSVQHSKQIDGLTSETMDLLMSHPWPGNVRELQNAIERAVVVCRGRSITPDDLPGELFESGAAPDAMNITVPMGTTLEDVERTVIRETLKRTRGDRMLAARILGIALRTVYRKIPVDGEKP